MEAAITLPNPPMPEMWMHIKYAKRGHFLPYERQNYSIKIHFGAKVISLSETFKKIIHVCIENKTNSPVRNKHSSHFLMVLIIVHG